MLGQTAEELVVLLHPFFVSHLQMSTDAFRLPASLRLEKGGFSLRFGISTDCNLRLMRGLFARLLEFETSWHYGSFHITLDVHRADSLAYSSHFPFTIYPEGHHGVEDIVAEGSFQLWNNEHILKGTQLLSYQL